MIDSFIRNAPSDYLRMHIAMAECEIRHAMARRLADPTSARYMRACVRWAIRNIREYRAELLARGVTLHKEG